MSSLDQLLPFRHAFRNLVGQIRIYVIIIRDGIGRARLSLHYFRMLLWNPISRIIRLRGMTYDSGIPYMRDTHVVEFLQRLVIKGGELATTIFGNRAGLDESLITIAEKSG